MTDDKITSMAELKKAVEEKRCKCGGMLFISRLKKIKPMPRKHCLFCIRCGKHLIFSIKLRRILGKEADAG